MNPRFLSEVPFTEEQIQGEGIGGKKVRREDDLNFLPFGIFFLLMSEFFRSGPKYFRSMRWDIWEEHCAICQSISYILQKNGRNKP